MKKNIMFVVLLLSSVFQTMAVNRLTLGDVTSGKFYGRSMAAVQALADGESYAQLSSDWRRVVKYSFKTGEEVGVLFDVAQAKEDSIELVEGYIMSPDGRQMLIETDNTPIYRHSFTATYYIYNMESGHLRPLSENGAQQTPLFSPDGSKVAFVRDNNIFLVDMVNGIEQQVTRDGSRNAVINGIPDWVNEEELATTALWCLRQTADIWSGSVTTRLPSSSTVCSSSRD